MIGDTVGSYRIVARIGEGGMGTVYLAEHVLLGKRAAVKVMLPELSRDPAFAQRFFNEARATTLIRHPGLVDVFDFGHLPDGSVFLVMEFLDGQSLSALIQQRGRLTTEWILDICRQVASAVSAAHDRGIIHRDLKPDNIFLLEDADRPLGVRVKVLDFGIAKVGGEAPANLKTRTGVVLGTPTYMSPEQCRGAGLVDHRTDIYALGCLLYEMACGQPPFVGDGVGEVVAAQIYAPVPPLGDLAPDVPPELEVVIRRALKKKPDDRFRSMAEVVAALDGIGGERAAAAAEPVAPQVGAAAATPSGEVSTKTTLAGAAGERTLTAPLPARRRLASLLLLAIAGLCGVGVMAHVFVEPKTAAQPMAVPGASGREIAPAAPPVNSVAPKPAAAPSVCAAAAPVSRIRVRLDSRPGGAAVYRMGGERIGVTPFVEERERSTSTSIYVLRLPGFHQESIAMPLAADGTAIVTLSRRLNDPPRRREKKGANPKRKATVDPFTE